MRKIPTLPSDDLSFLDGSRMWRGLDCHPDVSDPGFVFVAVVHQEYYLLLLEVPDSIRVQPGLILRTVPVG